MKQEMYIRVLKATKLTEFYIVYIFPHHNLFSNTFLHSIGYSSFVYTQWMTLSLVNLELYVLSRSTNKLGLNFRWVQSKLGLTIETSVSLAQQIQQTIALAF